MGRRSELAEGPHEGVVPAREYEEIPAGRDVGSRGRCHKRRRDREEGEAEEQRAETQWARHDHVKGLGCCVGGGFRRFDSLALEADGNICVATLMTGGITVAQPTGGTLEFFETNDPFTTNICFGGENLRTAYLTLSWQGLLTSCSWPRSGLALNFLNA